jgi:hypothetical protein
MEYTFGAGGDRPVAGRFVIQANTPTATPRPTFTPTVTPSIGCRVRFTTNKNGYNNVYSLLTTPTPPQDILIPINTEADVFAYYIHLSINIAQISYQNNKYWVNASSGLTLLTGNCSTNTTPIAPTVNAQKTPAVEDPLIIYSNNGQPCPVTGGSLMPNTVAIDLIDCQYSKYMFPHIQSVDKDEMSRMLRLMQRESPSNLNNAYEFKLRMENFFCVKLGNIEPGPTQLTYRHLTNIFLALSHTSYAFLQTDPSLGSLRGASCAIFQSGNSRLTIQRNGITGSGAVTSGFFIYLYNNGGTPNNPQNLVHEIGHYFNGRLYGYQSQGSELRISQGSPLDIIFRELKPKNINNVSISKVNGNVWERGSGLASVNFGWQQNLGGAPPCSLTPSCSANEEFADMFLNWVYDVAGTTNNHNAPVFINPENSGLAGTARKNFMNSRMRVERDSLGNGVLGYGWIDCVVMPSLSFCPKPPP